MTRAHKIFWCLCQTKPCHNSHLERGEAATMARSVMRRRRWTKVLEKLIVFFGVFWRLVIVGSAEGVLDVQVLCWQGGLSFLGVQAHTSWMRVSHLYGGITSYTLTRVSLIRQVGRRNWPTQAPVSIVAPTQVLISGKSFPMLPLTVSYQLIKYIPRTCCIHFKWKWCKCLFGFLCRSSNILQTRQQINKVQQIIR